LADKYHVSQRTVYRYLAQVKDSKKVKAAALLPSGTNTTQGEIASEEMKQHDRRVFQESDEILNENNLDILLDRLLIGNRFYFDEARMLGMYLLYFEKESNKYVIPVLNEHSKKCYKIIDSLSRFIEYHSDIVRSGESRGTKYKLYPGGDAERFYDELTNDKTRPKAERRMANKVERLTNECREAYKKYRSIIRETLFV
ncbi:MAG: hypothetical protein ABID87_09375, partial [Chloroflexota bacterium]